MSKCVLLTGAAGFIGSHLTEKLIEKNYEVIILTRTLNDDFSRIEHLIPKIKICDVKKESIVNLFNTNKIDFVLHLATYYKKNHTIEDIDSMIDANITLGTLLLDQMRIHNIKYFINTGTFFEYNTDVKKIDENTPNKPYNLYAATKVAFSNIAFYYSLNHGIKVIDLKLFSPYGPKDNEKLISFLIKNFINKTQFEITKGEQQWNWTYVEDIVDAYIKAIKYFEKMSGNYEKFNIGNSKTESINYMIEILEEITGVKNIANRTKPYLENEIFNIACDNSKAALKLEWIPKFDLKKGLKKTYDSYISK